MDKLIKQSVLSGFLVSMGVVINIQADNKYIGAMLFSLALLTIIKCNLKLYTGKIGFIGDVSIKELGIMFFGNIAGSLIPILIVYSKDGFLEKIYTVSEYKFAQGYIELLMYGFMCGVLMFIAVYCKNYLITVFCIMVFILSGYEHCIADFPLLCLSFSFENLGKFMCIVIGNSFGSIITRKLIE